MNNQDLKNHILRVMLHEAKEETLDLIAQGEDIASDEDAIKDFAADMFHDMPMSEFLDFLDL